MAGAVEDVPTVKSREITRGEKPVGRVVTFCLFASLFRPPRNTGVVTLPAKRVAAGEAVVVTGGIFTRIIALDGSAGTFVISP